MFSCYAVDLQTNLVIYIHNIFKISALRSTCASYMYGHKDSSRTLLPCAMPCYAINNIFVWSHMDKQWTSKYPKPFKRSDVFIFIAVEYYAFFMHSSLLHDIFANDLYVSVLHVGNISLQGECHVLFAFSVYEYKVLIYVNNFLILNLKFSFNIYNRQDVLLIICKI